MSRPVGGFGRAVKLGLLRVVGLPWMEELFGPEVPAGEGGGERGLAGDCGGLDQDGANVMVEAGDLVSVVVPMLDLEGAITLGSGPALAPGVAVGEGNEGADVDESSPTRPGSGYLGDQASAEAQRGQLVGAPPGPVIAGHAAAAGR